MDKLTSFFVCLAIILVLFAIRIGSDSNISKIPKMIDNSDKNLVVYTVENGEMVQVKAIVVSTNGIERIIK
jgi:hypothetical protein